MLKLRDRVRPTQIYRFPSGKHAVVVRVRQVNVTCRYLPDGSDTKCGETMVTRAWLMRHATQVRCVDPAVKGQLDLFKAVSADTHAEALIRQERVLAAAKRLMSARLAKQRVERCDELVQQFIAANPGADQSAVEAYRLQAAIEVGL
ncbi:MAG: hypothetical protein IIZ92_03390 [Aquincola sp.]|nr:hypothetical protein [Aquincola sp.]